LDKQLLIYVTLGVFVWAITGSAVAAYFYTQYNVYREEYVGLTGQLSMISMKVDVLLSYSNRKVWYNSTLLPLGSTAFTALNFTTEEMNYTDYGGELGILVTSINGVTNNSTHGWFYWRWNPESSEWTLPNYSAAKHILHQGDTVAYAYANYAEWPPPPPT
jgi:hypothetical protein